MLSCAVWYKFNNDVEDCTASTFGLRIICANKQHAESIISTRLYCIKFQKIVLSMITSHARVQEVS
jgi:hypothetical protein